MKVHVKPSSNLEALVPEKPESGDVCTIHPQFYRGRTTPTIAVVSVTNSLGTEVDSVELVINENGKLSIRRREAITPKADKATADRPRENQ